MTDTIRELRELLADGAVSGSWSPEQTARFQRRCCEFIGKYGESLLDIAEAAEKEGA